MSNQGSQKIKNFPNFTQFVAGRGKSQTLVFHTGKPVSFLPSCVVHGVSRTIGNSDDFYFAKALKRNCSKLKIVKFIFLD